MKRAIGILAASALLSSSLADVSYAADDIEMPVNYQPAANSDEGGLWMLSADAEKQVQTSPNLVRDAALNGYVQNVVCRLAGPYCPSIRIYVLDVPAFNASMSPNGMMIVNTGLLLRTENEAQLAFVLAHEISHYRLRHTLARYRTIRDGAGAMMLISIATAGAGFGLVGAAINLAASGALFAFTRDQEREADAHGFDLAVANGYDPREAPRIWTNIAAEDAADPLSKKHYGFTASHPAPKERLETLAARAGELADQRNDWKTGGAEYRQVTGHFRSQWLAENFASEYYDSCIVLLNRMIQTDPDSSELHFYLGEAYRKRNASDDLAKAIDAYKVAMTENNTPAGAFKGLGIAAMKSGDPETARTAFQKYLSMAPAADDTAMIESYLSRL